MSVSLKKVRERVMARLRESDHRRPSFGLPEIDQAIAESYLAAQSLLPPPVLYTANALTIGAGGDTFTLPLTVSGYSTAEYAGDVRLQLANAPYLYLRKITTEQLDANRNGSVMPFLSLPTMFALYEDSGQVIRGRCYPGAQVAQPCHLYATMSADDVRDFADMDTVNILFSRIAAHALVLLTSADLVERMDADDLKMRRLNPAVAKSWRADAERQLYADACRHHDTETVGRIERWTS